MALAADMVLSVASELKVLSATVGILKNHL